MLTEHRWPVIAIIVVGGLIIFSIVWCLARCLCCGLSCCCSCFKCFKCCGNCCGCCDAPGERKHKYLDESYADPHNQNGYKSQAPMFAPSVHPVSHNNIGPAAATASSPPQYAEFDVSRKRDSNALPAMPTWESSNAKRISMEEIVELEPMKKPQASQSALSVNTGPQDPLMQGRQNTQPSPVNGGYGVQPGQPLDPYSPGGQPYDTYNDNGYGQPQGNSPYGQEPGYGAGPAAAMAMGAGRTRTPHQERNGYRSPGPGHPASRSPGPQQDYNGYDQPGYGQQNAYGQQNGYEQDAYGMPGRGPASPGPGGRGYPARTGPSPAPAGYRRSPGPQNDMGYDRQDPYAESAYDRPQYPQDRQYSNNSSQRMAAPAPVSPGPQNSGGFDFQSGYTRPSQFDEYDGPPPRPAQQDRPPPSSGSEIIYPGYKAYQPAQQGWSGV